MWRWVRLSVGRLLPTAEQVTSCVTAVLRTGSRDNTTTEAMAGAKRGRTINNHPDGDGSGTLSSSSSVSGLQGGPPSQLSYSTTIPSSGAQFQTSDVRSLHEILKEKDVNSNRVVVITGGDNKRRVLQTRSSDGSCTSEVVCEVPESHSEFGSCSEVLFKMVEMESSRVQQLKKIQQRMLAAITSRDKSALLALIAEAKGGFPAHTTIL